MAARVHRGTYDELFLATEKEGEGMGGTHCILTFMQSKVGGLASRRDDVAVNWSAADLLRRGCGRSGDAVAAALELGLEAEGSGIRYLRGADTCGARQRCGRGGVGLPGGVDSRL